MKRIQKFYLLMLLVAACNNTNNQNASTLAASVSPATTATESTTAFGGCNNLILFHKGAVLVGASYDTTGKETGRQTTTVTDVVDAGGITEAHVRNDIQTPIGKKTMDIVYKCDGKNLYMDMNAMIQNFSVAKDAKAKADPIPFPLS